MDLYQSTGFLVNRLAQGMATELDRRFRHHGVTTSQWGVLAVLWKQEGIPQVEIQQQLRVEAATITGILQRMEQHELIRRKPDPSDKRAQLVYLTDKGRDLKSKLVPEAQAVNEIALTGFTEDEIHFFVRLMSRALDNFQ